MCANVEKLGDSMGKGSKRNRVITLAEFEGDKGTGTLAAKAGTVLEEIKNEAGENPNRRSRRIRIDRADDMVKRGQLSLRQYQAAKEIRDAWCKVQTLSSGGEMKEQVDASPKPDAVISRQVDAMSRLKHAMDAVPNAMRAVVEHVCWYNEPLHRMPGIKGTNSANLKVALDLVANKMKY